MGGICRGGSVSQLKTSFLIVHTIKCMHRFSRMGFFKKSKKSGTVTTTEYDSAQSSYSLPTTKLRDSSISEYPSLIDFERKDLAYKNRIRWLRFVSRTLSLILSAYMIGSMTYTLIMYFTTRARMIDNVSVWGAPKILWPTYLVLSMAVVAFIMNFITLTSYLCSVAAANKSGNFTIFFGYFMLGVEIVVWAVSSGLYKFADNGNDLWGYSCGSQAEQIEAQVASFMSFGKLCQTQSVTWYACIIQTACYILTLVTLVFVVRRASGKRRILKIRESQLMQNDNVQGTMPPAGETAYNPGFGRQYMPVSKTSAHV